MSELPPGWAMTTISDITEYLSRGKQPKYTSYNCSTSPLESHSERTGSGIKSTKNLHNVNREQHQFIETFGEKVLPELREPFAG